MVLIFFLATLGFASFEVTLSLLNNDALHLDPKNNFYIFSYVGFVLMLTQGVLYRRLAKRYGKPVAIQTDVNGAALAEAKWGVAQGLSSHAYITIGTGVGVGLISGGRPVQGYAHAEAGHMRVARAAGAIGEDEEADRCWKFLADSSADAYAELSS